MDHRGPGSDHRDDGRRDARHIRGAPLQRVRMGARGLRVPARCRGLRPVRVSGRLRRTGRGPARVRGARRQGRTGAGPARPCGTWDVDRTAPEVRIDEGPREGSRSAGRRFSFGTTENVAFRCSLDDAPWEACTPPVRYPGLTTGAPHVPRPRRRRGRERGADAHAPVDRRSRSVRPRPADRRAALAGAGFGRPARPPAADETPALQSPLAPAGEGPAAEPAPAPAAPTHPPARRTPRRGRGVRAAGRASARIRIRAVTIRRGTLYVDAGSTPISPVRSGSRSWRADAA
jgi:hypothetical protein